MSGLAGKMNSFLERDIVAFFFLKENVLCIDVSSFLPLSGSCYAPAISTFLSSSNITLEP